MEAAFALPVLMVLLLLLIQPGIVLYDRMVMQAAAAEKLSIDILLMDPPRSGSTPEFLSAAVKMAPHRIVYISCCPETQARDLALLQKGGYRVTLLQPVDMFPHTEHIENIAVLERRSTR